MSFLGSIGSFLKNPIQPITHAIGNTVGVTANLHNGIHVDPKKLALDGLALAIPGVGGLAGKALGGLGGALGSIPGVGALGGAVGAIPGVSAIGSIIKGDPSSGAGAGYDPALGEMVNNPSGSNSGGVLSGIGHLLTGGSGIAANGGAPSQGGGLLSSIEGLLTGNHGLNALGIAQGVNTAMTQKKANDYANKAVGGMQASYDQRAPLRVQGIQGLLNPETPDLSALTATRTTGSPYARGAA